MARKIFVSYKHSKDRYGRISTMGANPFSHVRVPGTRMLMSTIVKCYKPSGRNSTERYNWISNNISRMVEEAIAIRNEY